MTSPDESFKPRSSPLCAKKPFNEVNKQSFEHKKNIIDERVFDTPRNAIHAHTATHESGMALTQIYDRNPPKEVYFDLHLSG